MRWMTAELKEGTTLKLPDGWLPPEYYDALNVLFRVENALRVFVYMVLKNAHGGSWTTLQLSSDDSNAGTIGSIAKQREEQDRKYGYLGMGVTSPLMYLTSGELIRLMLSDNEWRHFADYFVASRELIRTKLEEIGNVRNALAHFRPLTVDDVQLVKSNARHVLVEIERTIEAILSPTHVVPTNTTAAWYQTLTATSTAPLGKTIRQSADEKWVALWLSFECACVRPSIDSETVMNPGLLHLHSSAMLREFPDLRKYVTCVSESSPTQYGGPGPNDLKFRKHVILTFGKNLLEAEHRGVSEVLAAICERVAEESALVMQDELARGTLVRMVDIRGRRIKVGESQVWRCNTSPLSCTVMQGDGSEYWGVQEGGRQGDWISDTRDYPWAPKSLGFVLDDDIPF